MARDGAIEVTLRGELVDVDEVDLETIKGPLRLRLAPKQILFADTQELSD
jgi:hypothetical protein